MKKKHASSFLTRRTFIAMALAMSIAALTAIAGCDIWRPPAPTPEELDRGLVVLYPGSLNSVVEMAGFYNGLRAGGVDQAVEIIPWSGPDEHFYVPNFLEHNRDRWVAEARRIAEYSAAHPGAPITLLGYSGGALTCIRVAEEMPLGTAVDCVIMMSPGVWRYYDLTAMLEKVSQGVVVYWSPNEHSLNWLISWAGTADQVFTDPANSSGFATEHEKLRQYMWGPEFARYGNNGEHFEYYLSVPWIAEFVTPWIAHGPAAVVRRVGGEYGPAS